MVTEREAVFAGVALWVIWYMIKTDRRPAIHDGLRRFVEAFRSGTESSLKIGATIGVIGIIIGGLTFTGFVLTAAYRITSVVAVKHPSSLKPVPENSHAPMTFRSSEKPLPVRVGLL